MSNQDIIEEYLVKLGYAAPDTVGFARFQQSLRDINSVVDNTYVSMAKKVLGFQAGVTGAFAAFGAAALTFADKTAMADQEYRLLAMHMYTSLPVARELQVALTALGQPLENIMWDPELAARFHQLVKDQQIMTQEIGPDFENQMLKIRDLRFEFTRFGVELQYLTMEVVKDLAEAFGFSLGKATDSFKNFNDYIRDHIPQIANWIATHLKPVLIDTYNVLEKTWQIILQIGQSLKGIDWVSLIGDIANAVRAMIQLEQNMVFMFAAANAARKGNFSEAMDDLKKMQVITFGSPAANIPVAGAGGRAVVSQEQIRSMVIADAQALGVSPQLALAVAQQESGFKQYDSSGQVLRNAQSGALGVMQLLPGTARDMGVDPSLAAGNVLGGVKYLAQLLSRYKDEATALSHYGGRGGAESQQYAREVMAREGTINITVNATTNATASEIANTVADAFEKQMYAKRQRRIQEFSTYGAY